MIRRGARPIRLAVFALGLTLATPALANERFDQLLGDAKAAMLVDPAKAAAVAGTAERTAAAEPVGPDRQHDLAAAKWLQGEAALRLNAPDRAEPLITAGLALLAGAKPTKLNGDLLLSRGGLNAAQARVGEALADYQAAHDIFRDIGETRSQSIALVLIGSLYQSADDNESALKNFGRALDAYAGDPGLTHTIHNNRGNALMELKRYSEAGLEFERALALAREMKSPGIAAQIYRNIARLKIDQGDLGSAEHAIAQGLRLAPHDTANWRAQFDAIAADVALKRGQLSQARSLITTAFAGVDLTRTDLGYREAHYTAYDVFTKLGDQERALAHLRAMKRLDDQVWKLTASTNNALMAARFDSANQDARIAKLKADDLARKVALEQAQARFQRILFGSIGLAALVVMGLLAAGLYQSRRARIRLGLSNRALEKALAAKTEFLATTSHEIRTPLNGILGMTQVMLADASLTAAARDRLGIVQDAGLTMRALVDDILDVAKMETGNLTMEALPFDLKAMLSDVTRMWSEQARAKGLEFRLELADCPHGILGDAGRLRQVVYNLLSNAVKFTASGAVTVRATGAGDRLTIAVADTGIGIAADKHDEIFESFKQADGGTTRQFGGTGLGLAICKNIARGMDGVIRVDSAPGDGATFTLDIPFTAAALAAPAAPTGDGALLIVDRNPIARAMLKAVLEPRAGAVVFAGSCAEALVLARQGGVTRLLVDEATARQGEADPVAELAGLAAAGLPLAVLWASPDGATRAALATAGATQVIAKPIAGPALAALLFDRTDQTALVTRAA